MFGQKNRPCGNPKCGVSTGIHDGLTFGHGNLNMNGYWAFPCYVCARAHEKEYPEDTPCWPFEITRNQLLTAEAHMLHDAKQEIKGTLALLENIVGTMRDRKVKEDGSEPYHKEQWAQYDETFIQREVAGPLACVLAELEKVRTPEK